MCAIYTYSRGLEPVLKPRTNRGLGVCVLLNATARDCETRNYFVNQRVTVNELHSRTVNYILVPCVYEGENENIVLMSNGNIKY